LTQGGVGSLKDECGERNGKKNSNKTVVLQIIFCLFENICVESTFGWDG